MNAISPITTHVLDTALGRPGVGIGVELEIFDPLVEPSWKVVGSGQTNSDGRVTDLLPPGELSGGHYRISFKTAEYFQDQDNTGFYPVVRIEFQIDDPSRHFHLPLLLSPFGYSTYRGS